MALKIRKDDVPKFTGENFEDPERWIEEINDFIETLPQDMKDVDKKNTSMQIFKFGLEKTAGRWFHNLPREKRKDLKLAMEAFKKQYNSAEQRVANYKLFSSREQREDENAESYGYELMALMQLAVPDMEQDQRVLKYISGLQPELEEIMNRQKPLPTTMIEAIKIAKNEEALMSQKKTRKRKAEEDKQSELAKSLKSLSDQVRKITENPSPRYRNFRQYDNNGNHGYNGRQYDNNGNHGYNGRQHNWKPHYNQEFNGPRIKKEHYGKRKFNNTEEHTRKTPSRNEKGEPICFKCGKAGHIQFRCPEKSKDREQQPPRWKNNPAEVMPPLRED